MVLNRRGVIATAFAALISIFGFVAVDDGSDSAETESVKLIVSAASSMQDALKDIADAYEDSDPDIDIALNFASSGALQQQIERGAPVDVFLSASPRQMDALQAKGLLLAGTRRDLLGNQIVLVTGNDGAIAQFNQLTTEAVDRIVIGEPESVPAGTYSREVLSTLQIYDQLSPKLVFAKDVRQVLAYVESGNVSAGLIYTTDAVLSKRLKIIATAPPNSHTPIVYPVAVLKNSRHREAASVFMDFLRSDTAHLVFEQYGFELLP